MDIHKLTELEELCGVTLDDVARELPRVLLIDDGHKVVIDGKLGPALATSVARCALGASSEYLGHNTIGHSVYGRA